jgi:hypothetical protein
MEAMKSGTIRDEIQIGRVIRNAIVFDLKNWPGGFLPEDDLLQTVAGLFALLEERQVAYLLVGDVALLQFVEGRNADGIELIMDVASLKKLPELQVTGQSEDFARGTFGEVRIDILQTRNPLFEKVRRQFAATQHFAERDIPCATVEGLLLLKMHALPSLYRQGNFARVGLYENDIATLIQQYHPRLDPLFAELAPHMSETDLQSVRTIVGEIQQRIERFEQGRREGQ